MPEMAARKRKGQHLKMREKLDGIQNVPVRDVGLAPISNGLIRLRRTRFSAGDTTWLYAGVQMKQLWYRDA